MFVDGFETQQKSQRLKHTFASKYSIERSRVVSFSFSTDNRYRTDISLKHHQKATTSKEKTKFKRTIREGEIGSKIYYNKKNCRKVK